MNEQHPISDLVSSAMESIKKMVDVNTIVGTPIETQDGTTVIPISRVGFGFAAGGSEFEPKKKPENDSLFGGGSGAGVSISPIGFLVISNGDVKMIPVSDEAGAAIDKLLSTIPVAVDKVSDFIKKRKEKKETTVSEN